METLFGFSCRTAALLCSYFVSSVLRNRLWMILLSSSAGATFSSDAVLSSTRRDLFAGETRRIRHYNRQQIARSSDAGLSNSDPACFRCHTMSALPPLQANNPFIQGRQTAKHAGAGLELWNIKVTDLLLPAGASLPLDLQASGGSQTQPCREERCSRNN